MDAHRQTLRETGAVDYSWLKLSTKARDVECFTRLRVQPTQAHKPLPETDLCNWLEFERQ